MKKILVLAYAISPYKGSEYSVAWNYVTNMSKDNELVVLYGTSGEHIGDIQIMEDYLNEHEVPNIRFVPILSNKWIGLLNFFNRRGFFVYSFYWAFQAWQKLAYCKAKELIQIEHFDLIHNVGPIGYREPGYLWKLDLPYVWGPIGGFNNLPISMMKALPISGKLKLGIRSVLNILQMRYSSRVKKAIRRTDVLFTATSYNKKIVKESFHRDSILLPENCISGKINLDNIDKFDNEIFHLIWIGRIDANKSLMILLEALSKLRSKDKIELHVVGIGPLKNYLIVKCKEWNIENNVIWHGQVSRSEVFELLTQVHLHIITSVSEGNPTTVWEAMSVGVPTMTVDHCGMHDIVCDKCGIKIPVTYYDDIVNKFAAEIEKLQQHFPCGLKELSYATINCAQKYTWEKRVLFLNSIYDKVVNIKNE